jgi:hypothetical protein
MGEVSDARQMIKRNPMMDGRYGDKDDMKWIGFDGLRRRDKDAICLSRLD